MINCLHEIIDDLSLHLNISLKSYYLIFEIATFVFDQHYVISPHLAGGNWVKSAAVAVSADE